MGDSHGVSTEQSSDEQQADGQKQAAWYAACLEGWISTRLEHDKSLLTLSAGGIGLLITLKATIGVQSLWSFVAFVLAIAAFVVCLIVVLLIFERNSRHLEEVVKTGKPHDKLLAFLDRSAILAFLLGVVLSCGVGFAGAVHSLDTTKGSKMADSKHTPVKAGSVMVGDSVNGIHGMSPGKVILKKSFNGIANMAPASQGAAQSHGQSQGESSQPTSAPSAPATPSSSESQ